MHRDETVPRIVALFLITLSLVSCADARPIATPTLLPSVSAPSPALVPTATADLRPSITPLHGVTLTPKSVHVAVGHAYPFRLLTHCGVDFATDFDGSYWDLTDPRWLKQQGITPSVGNPFQDGTMTLVDTDTARFDYPGDHIIFRRHGGPKVVPGLCA